MAKLELKGTIVGVGEVGTVQSAKPFKKQIVILQIPAYRDEYGEIKGKEELWQIDLIGATVDKYELDGNDVTRKAKATVYLNSQFVEKKGGTGNEGMYIINCVLKEFEFVL